MDDLGVPLFLETPDISMGSMYGFMYLHGKLIFMVNIDHNMQIYCTLILWDCKSWVYTENTKMIIQMGLLLRKNKQVNALI